MKDRQTCSVEQSVKVGLVIKKFKSHTLLDEEKENCR